ncbi:hypothetical protein [Pseudoduganella sp. OTU4001]|uniref:hypothetical protein n=1 Tax=Pseudoduganella sp. OTU4001 TaxID=3043854 RepID=UPI00313D06C7
MELELATIGASVAGAIASKDILTKALGPTAEYFGGELKNLVARCNINLDDVFRGSVRKGAGDMPGSVDARTAKAVIDDAAYCEDALIKDYYSGLLCGAKSESGDDEALSYVSVLKTMSKIQVKTHFLIYAVMHGQVKGQITSITDERDRSKLRIYMNLERFFGFVGQPSADPEATINHIVSGLQRAGLIGQHFAYGDPSYVNVAYPDLKIEVPSLVVCPSILGVELFLWAAGIRNPNPNLILQSDEIMSRFPKEYIDAL